MGMHGKDGPGTKYRFSKKDYTAVDLQNFSYYSGAQISIWFGNIWIDDATSIGWQYNQEKRPIYGYASQYFDSVAKGQIIIQGQLAINFREKGYLSAVMRGMSTLKKNYTDSNTWETVGRVVSQHLRNGTFGPQTLDEIGNLGGSDNFWETAELYEKAIWGNLDDTKGADGRTNYTETPDVYQHKNFPDGFNLLVTYGDIGAMDPKSVHDMATSTTKTLTGVHLLGSSQVIQGNGEPIQEAYSFMARDMDEYVGTTF